MNMILYFFNLDIYLPDIGPYTCVPLAWLSGLTTGTSILRSGFGNSHGCSPKNKTF